MKHGLRLFTTTYFFINPWLPPTQPCLSFHDLSAFYATLNSAMNSVPVLSSSPTPRGFSDIPLTRRLTMADLCTDAGQSNTLHSPAEDSLRTAASSKRHHVAEEGSEAGPLAKRLCDEASAVEAKQNTLEQAKANKRPNFLYVAYLYMLSIDSDLVYQWI